MINEHILINNGFNPQKTKVNSWDESCELRWYYGPYLYVVVQCNGCYALRECYNNGTLWSTFIGSYSDINILVDTCNKWYIKANDHVTQEINILSDKKEILDRFIEVKDLN